MPPEEEPIAEEAYDALAGTYDEQVASSAYNADFAFPATTCLVPDPDGDRVLDAGCGTGVYSEWLVERGADVVGIDVSEEMLARACERVGDRATFRRETLGEPLSFAEDEGFDGVVSVLALGYVRDWRTTFAEFARLLRPGGYVVFTVGHPFDALPDAEDESYFETERTTKDWAVEVPYYRRPFGEMLEPVLDAGFRLERVYEPQPTEAFEERRPDRYEKESRYPVFLCVRARKA